MTTQVRPFSSTRLVKFIASDLIFLISSLTFLSAFQLLLVTSCEDRLALDIGADGLIPIVVMDVKLWGLLFLLLLLLGGLFFNVTKACPCFPWLFKT